MKKASKISQKKPVLRAVLILCLSLFVFGLLMTIHQAAGAADSEMSLLDIYREKKFKGALDEEQLKVQTDLQTSEAKKKKSQEAEEGF